MGMGKHEWDEMGWVDSRSHPSGRAGLDLWSDPRAVYARCAVALWVWTDRQTNCSFISGQTINSFCAVLERGYSHEAIDDVLTYSGVDFLLSSFCQAWEGSVFYDRHAYSAIRGPECEFGVGVQS